MRRGRKPIHIEIQQAEDPAAFKYISLQDALLDVIDLLAEVFETNEPDTENDLADQNEDENQ